MLKKQGIITEDPKYVGDAVFASALPPRKSAPLSAEQTQKLRTLLQSKNPDDLQLANKIIKGPPKFGIPSGNNSEEISGDVAQW